MATINLLYKREYPVVDGINIRIPTVGDIIEHEDTYYGLVSMLTAAPIDMMVQLDDIGIDFTTINDYDLFLLLFPGIQEMDTSLIFGDLDLSKFKPAVNEQSNQIVLVNADNDLVINRSVHNKIALVLRKILHQERNNKTPGNDETRKYLIDRARIKQKRNKRRTSDSQLESLIISMVNTEEFKYNFETALDLTIYQFNESVRQIIKKVDFNNRMIGVYAGTVNAKELKKDDLNWLVH